MIELNNICKSFYNKQGMKTQEFKSLENICLEIIPSQITGLIGLNGAGKTTLLRVIAGLYQPTQGEMSVKFSSIKEHRVSMLSSEQGLYKHLSVKNLIHYLGSLQNSDFSFNDDNTKYLISFLQLEKIIHKQVSALSSGWRQKVLILLAFINNPDIILLDEPSNYLDFQGQEQLSVLINQAREKHKTIIYASHNLFEIERIADSIIFIHQGKVVFHKLKDEMYDDFEGKDNEMNLLDIINYWMPND